MTRVPRPPSGLLDCVRFCRELIDFLSEHEERDAPNTLLSRTTRGTSRSALPSEGGGTTTTTEPEPILDPVQWEDRAWPAKSFCFRYAPEEMDNGTVGGTYHTQVAVVGGDVPPGEFGVDSLAAFVPTISGGVITGVTIASPGSGYLASSTYTMAVVDSGGGTGAVVSAVTDSDGSFTGSVTVTAGGSGYTDATTITAPGSLQKWHLFSKFWEQRFTYRKGTAIIRMDAGRYGITEPFLIITATEDSTTAKQIVLNLADITSPPGKRVIKLREWDVCVDGEAKKALFLSSEEYSA